MRSVHAQYLHSPAPHALEAGRYYQADHDIARHFRAVWIIVVLLLAGIGGWGATASISGAVVAPARVAVEGKRKAVQHLDGGVIGRLAVRDGDMVAAGDLIANLEGRDLEAERAGLAAEVAAKSRQIKSIEDELKNLLVLQAKRLVAYNRVAALQREAESHAADVARLSGQQARVEAKLARLEIRAPAAGRVHNLVTHTVGGVIAPNATIAEIVPTSDALVVEARLAPSDIDQVHDDQPASVRMTGLNLRVTPVLDGRVERVSADLMKDETTGRDYYLARIVLAEDVPARLGGRALVPGMPAEVLIETERRAAISYLTKPLTDQIARAFREE
jgi:HlyD family secretion protein